MAKSNIYETVEFQNWSDLRNELINKKDWIYRGVSDSKFSLKTSLERYFEDYSNLEKKDIVQYEKDMISFFERSIHLYVNNTETIVKSKYQKICFLQHYGAPTRLIDFTFSPFIACFFALKDMITKNGTEESAIYAFDVTIFKEIQNSAFGKMPNEKAAHKIPRTEGIGIASETIDDFIEIGYNDKNNTIAPFIGLVEPYYRFNRLTSQKGCFLIPFNIKIPFEENLRSAIKNINNKDNKVKKYIIKNEWRDEVLRELSKMNITSASLFPDIEGFIKSLKIETDISIQIQKERGYLN